MQKVSINSGRILFVLVFALLIWSSMFLMPINAEGLSNPDSLSAPAEDSNPSYSSEPITIRLNGTSYTYYTQVATANNLLAAEKPLTTAPAAPKGLTVAAVRSGQVDLVWNPSTDPNVTGYRVAYKPEGGTYSSFVTNTTSCTVSGLRNNVSYTLKVKSLYNTGEYSSYSTHVYATPKSSPPAEPTGLRVVSKGSGRLDLAWNANTETDLAGYRLAYKPAGGTYKSITTAINSCTLTGLTNGVTYTLKVKALNTSQEESTYSSFVYAAPQAPAQPAPKEPAFETEILAAGSKSATPLYVIRSSQPGPVVMVVGGVHGNEPAGYETARKIAKYSVKRGTLLVLPEANKLAIEAKRRYASGQSDLNRCFPQASGESPDTVLARSIYSAVKKYDVDWLIDLHEGYDYYKNPTDSVGQTLIYYPNSGTAAKASFIVDSLNKDITSSLKRFTLLKYPVQGSLARSTGQFLGVHSMIFETCNDPALSTRVSYHTKAVDRLLEKLEMK